MARAQQGAVRSHAATGKDAAVPSDLRSRASSYCRSGLKALGLLQTVILVAFAIFTQWRTAPVAAPQPAPEAPLPGAHVLTDETLPAFVDGFPDGALLNFHSPSCPHCRSLAPEFEAAARDLVAADGAPLAFVDVNAAPKAAERYGVFRYPTMLWFRSGEPVLELPPTVREADKISEYVNWASQPAVVAFDSRKELEESLPEMRAVLSSSTPPLICGFGVKGTVRAVLEATAEKLRGKSLFLFSEEAQEGDPALRAYFADASFDQDFMGSLDQKAVETWVKGLVKKAKAKRST